MTVIWIDPLKLRSGGTLTLVSGATGTNIGNCTGYGGLAAAFNGTTSQAQTACAAVVISNSGYNNTVGKQWSGSKTIGRFIIYAPNNANMLGAAGGTTVKLQGSNDGSAWTDLYTSATIGTTGSSADITTGIDTSAAYTYHRINGAGNGANTFAVAELIFYELI